MDQMHSILFALITGSFGFTWLITRGLARDDDVKYLRGRMDELMDAMRGRKMRKMGVKKKVK